MFLREKMGIFCGFVLLLILLPVATMAESRMEIFMAPPEPTVLADILFKPRYRNVNNQRIKQTNMFGMMINFEFDSTKIIADSLPLLDSVGEMLTLEKTRKEILVIEGHTDAKGAEYYNQGLSERRAEAIKNYLSASFDIDPKRLITVGKGESRLHDSSQPASSINRRAVFRPMKSVVVH